MKRERKKKERKRKRPEKKEKNIYWSRLDSNSWPRDPGRSCVTPRPLFLCNFTEIRWSIYLPFMCVKPLIGLHYFLTVFSPYNDLLLKLLSLCNNTCFLVRNWFTVLKFTTRKQLSPCSNRTICLRKAAVVERRYCTWNGYCTTFHTFGGNIYSSTYIIDTVAPL